MLLEFNFAPLYDALQTMSWFILEQFIIYHMVDFVLLALIGFAKHCLVKCARGYGFRPCLRLVLSGFGLFPSGDWFRWVIVQRTDV